MEGDNEMSLLLMDVSSAAVLSNWIQIAVQGGAMGLLVLIIIKGPIWMSNFINGLINTMSEQGKEQGERFVKALGDMTAANQRQSELDRAAFERRNEVLRATQEAVRLAIVNQETKFTSVLFEMQELTRQVQKAARAVAVQSKASVQQAKATTRVADRVIVDPDEPQRDRK